MFNIIILPGDGIGPEIIKQAVKILKTCCYLGYKINLLYNYIGGISIDKYNSPITNKVLKICNESDAIILGCVGGYKWSNNPIKPEQGLLKLRKQLNFFSNLRPIKCPFKNIDFIIVRELTGGIYYGKPKGVSKQIINSIPTWYSYDTELYNEQEIIRIAKIAFNLSLNRKKKLTSIDKSNVLSTSKLWRKIINYLSNFYNNIKLNYLYIDYATIELIKNYKNFDVVITSNIFGDIISDQCSLLTGSLGMLPSISLNNKSNCLIEPCHGSAPDIAGKNIANPIGMLLSLVMLFEYLFNNKVLSNKLFYAIYKILSFGFCTLDMKNYFKNSKILSTEEFGDLTNYYFLND
ncbi:3-isopropylmalate dehydrogenase [Candidatus Carsonella ruddii]|uniref:3-isopropylmalate dehydrogenase n=1 Tax=Candidatus Carsonella ruddii (Diaphorina cf. continua) TaxID=2661587 RepID=A0A7R6W0E8_CARRU|nr:3-isopropylmalate dehydrogenase [Candidatus Carsonella ruddii (Diaphorina cf. continua)]BCG49315.1 3-isopropylmalate dehydrogenase [Candidatus Carsonella ruddii (Diaphorina cf. continua)]